MTERTFIFHEDDVSLAAEDFTTLAKNIRAEIESMRTSIDSTVADWSKVSDSRQAQLRFDSKMSDRVEELTNTLDSAAQAMETVRELGQHAEVRNVALLD